MVHIHGNENFVLSGPNFMFFSFKLIGNNDRHFIQIGILRTLTIFINEENRTQCTVLVLQPVCVLKGKEKQNSQNFIWIYLKAVFNIELMIETIGDALSLCSNNVYKIWNVVKYRPLSLTIDVWLVLRISPGKLSCLVSYHDDTQTWRI